MVSTFQLASKHHSSIPQRHPGIPKRRAEAYHQDGTYQERLDQEDGALQHQGSRRPVHVRASPSLTS